SIFNFTSGALRTRSTTNSNGSPLVIGDGGSPATFQLLGNGTHDFRGASGLTISSNAVLTGNGTLLGSVVVQGGGVLVPGTSIGKMSFSNAPSMQGAIIMEISKNGTVLSNDLIQVAGTLIYGGALVVSNLGPTALANGDK